MTAPDDWRRAFLLKLFKYLKPYAAAILISIALLFAQAMCDLALPDYMSRIVNVGIQQGGIESAAPEALTTASFAALAGTSQAVAQSYTLILPGDPLFDDYHAKYPKADEGLYALNAYGVEHKDDIALELSSALLSMAGPSQPSAKSESMAGQAAIMFVKQEYEALGADTAAIQSSYIWSTGLVMLLIALAGVACMVTVGFLSARVGAGFSRDLRKKVYDRVTGFSNAEFDKFSTASLITRSTNDITQVMMAVIIMMRMVVYAPIMGVGGVVRALSKSVSMSWIIALGVILLLGFIFMIYCVVMPKFKRMQSLVDRLNLVTRETLSGLMVIRAFNTQSFERGRFTQANKDITKTNLFVTRGMALMFPFMTIIMNGLSVLIIWVGANQVASSGMQVGDIMAFMQYAMQIVMSFLVLSMLFIMLPRASVSAQRIREVIDTQPTLRDPKAPKGFDPDKRGVLTFDNVSFKYPGASDYVVSGISFTARPGQVTAIIGATGSGKSTIANLIPRFYDVTDGKITLGGVDIREVNKHDLREKVGFVAQNSILFSGTVESNLRLANENAADGDIERALSTAQAGFISEKPEGAKADVAQGGANFSGGQKQRLSIARTLLKDADVYIFDDSFSALDFKTDAQLRRDLVDKMRAKTQLIIAQRVGTIRNADQIIVLDEGVMAGIGTHEELMRDCEEYREIAYSQLSKEELS